MSTTETTNMLDRLRANRLDSLAQVDTINGEPTPATLEEHTSYLTPLLGQFILLASFFMIAPSDADGNCDVSPKSDPASSVKILDRLTGVGGGSSYRLIDR